MVQSIDFVFSSLLDVGGVDIILQAMVEYRESGRIQLEGCRALFSLVIRPLSKSRLVALNGIDCIVKGKFEPIISKQNSTKT